jgi:hypothetical protein
MTGTVKTESESRKTVAAILAAVAALMQEEESAQKVRLRRRPVQVTSLWPLMGREEMMRMRTMWQRRLT